MNHSILFKQHGSAHITRGQSYSVDRTVVHYASMLASACNNATHFSRNKCQGSSTHYFANDLSGESTKAWPRGDTARHGGN